MCIGVPGRVVSITADGQRAQVMMAGAARDVDISFLTGEEAAEVGDYVLVHVGFAMGKMTAEEAVETERMLEDFIQQSSFGGPAGDPVPLSEGRRPIQEVAR
jgi:hydrogenase expression/formation protein HypC